MLKSAMISALNVLTRTQWTATLKLSVGVLLLDYACKCVSGEAVFFWRFIR